MRPKCLLRQGVELAGPDVLFELTVPDLGIKVREPGTERRQLFRGESLDLPFDFLDSRQGMHLL